MDFFNSLTLDLKLLLAAIAVCALLAMFTTQKKNEGRYLLLLGVLALVGVYRYMHTSAGAPEIATLTHPEVVAPDVHKPIVSTAAH